MEEKTYTISLGQLFSIAAKRWWIILLAVLVGAGLLFAYSNFLVTPVYTTNAMLGVTSINMTEYQGALVGQTIAKECSEILMANITLEKAAENLNNYFSEKGEAPYRMYTANTLRSMIGTATSTESRYFTVTVKSVYPDEAKLVCDMVTQTFCDVMIEENLIKGAEGRVIHHAVTPQSPSSPNVTTNTLLGAIIGLVISFGTLVVLAFLKDTIDSEDWLVETYNEKIPVLAVIPDSETHAGRRSRRYTSKYGYHKYGYGYGEGSKN